MDVFLSTWWVVLLWAGISMAVVAVARESAREFIVDKQGYSAYIGEFIGFCICVSFVVLTLL